MPRLLRYLCISMLLIAQQVAADGLPLFASDGQLTLTLETAMNTIVTQQKQRPSVDGVIRYADDAGQTVSIPVTVSTRGKSRLELCRFPPLSISMKRKKSKGTLFEGQTRLKLVTQCKRGSKYQNYLLQEYGIYRAFNVLTDSSFRVRMFDITYVDNEGRRKDQASSGFFIERDNEVAARLGLKRLKIPKIDAAILDAEHANLLSLFQFLAGNTDWSMTSGPPDSGCCHNAKILAVPGADSGMIAIPYDFDQAGLINTEYATPAEGLPIKSVRKRLYRGRCVNLRHFESNVERFNERRQEIEQALAAEQITKRARRSAEAYVQAFYDIVNDPKKRNKYIYRKCRGPKPAS